MTADDMRTALTTSMRKLTTAKDIYANSAHGHGHMCE